MTRLNSVLNLKECLSASEKIKEMQIQHERLQRLPMDARESGALHALLDTKVFFLAKLDVCPRNAFKLKSYFLPRSGAGS